MMYILIQCSGSYDDYYENYLFVSRDYFTLETKMKELEEKNKKNLEIRDEYDVAVRNLGNEIGYPIDGKISIDEFVSRNEKLKKEFLVSKNLSEDECYSILFCEKYDYKIEEVEEL